MNRLLNYPYVIVRVDCTLCKRGGQYRLTRIAAKFGTEITLDDLLDRLAVDCPWRRAPRSRPPGKYEAKCRARFPDIENAPLPPNLPPAMMGLRIIEGGKDPAVDAMPKKQKKR